MGTLGRLLVAVQYVLHDTLHVARHGDGGTCRVDLPAARRYVDVE